MEGEVYHIFNRGAHKMPIFLDEGDFRRFQILLLLTNSTKKVDAGNTLAKYQGRSLVDLSLVDLFKNDAPEQRLVDVLTYALIPNHFHLVLRQRIGGGITSFMKKLCTGYSMYFNLRHDRSGTLFQGRFKSSHVDTDPYHKWLFAYVHLNPVSVVEPDWKEKGVKNQTKVAEFLREYPYSSYYDYYVHERPERAILAHEEARDFLDTNENLIGLIAESEKGASLYENFESGEK